MSSKLKMAIVFVVLICVAGILWMAATGQRSLTTITYSQFLDRVRSGQVASVVVMGAESGVVEAICRLKDGAAVRTVLPWDYRDAMAAMQDKMVNIEIRDSVPATARLLMNAAPFLILLAVWVALLFRKFPNGPWRNALG